MASLLVILLVPLVVGWCMERAAYGNARATENLLAPLGVTTPAPQPAARQPWRAKGVETERMPDIVVRAPAH